MVSCVKFVIQGGSLALFLGASRAPPLCFNVLRLLFGFAVRLNCWSLARVVEPPRLVTSYAMLFGGASVCATSTCDVLYLGFVCATAFWYTFTFVLLLVVLLRHGGVGRVVAAFLGGTACASAIWSCYPSCSVGRVFAAQQVGARYGSLSLEVACGITALDKLRLLFGCQPVSIAEFCDVCLLAA